MQNLAAQTFEEVLENNKKSIYRICRIYARSPIEPKDLFQEVVIQLWKSFSTFKGKSNISTWIYKIALNVCYTSKMKLEKKNDKMVRLESIEIIPGENVPDESQRERYRALHDCISSLNKYSKSIVILYLEDLPYKEIAEISGLTENHVAVKMKRIRKKLLDCMTAKL